MKNKNNEKDDKDADLNPSDGGTKLFYSLIVYLI